MIAISTAPQFYDVLFRKKIIFLFTILRGSGPLDVCMKLCITQTLMAFHATDTVWAAKQKLLTTSVLKVCNITLRYYEKYY